MICIKYNNYSTRSCRNELIANIYSGKLQNNQLRSQPSMFQFVKTNTGVNLYERFLMFVLNCRYNYLKYFLHFRKLTVKNLNSILSCFLCFLELRFQEESQFLLGQLGKPRRHLEFHYT